jgi:hypothetical protein
MSLAKVEGFSNLRKDTSNGGVVNVDKGAYQAHLARKRVNASKALQEQAMQDKVASLQNEINTIKSDVSDIKDLLMQLLQKGN